MRSRQWPPRQHVHRGYARVSWGGVWYHLGRAGSAEAKDNYSRLTNVWKSDPYYEPDEITGLTVAELCRDYLAARPFPPGKLGQYRRAVRLFLQAHRGLTVDGFGPVLLGAWQKALADRPKGVDSTDTLSKTYISMLIRIIRGVWRWGVATERVAVGQWQALGAVRGLRAGEARPGRRVEPVPDEHFARAVVELVPAARGLVCLLRLTGARPGELWGLTPGDLGRSSDPWIFRPERHKTAEKGGSRAIVFGPLARAILERHWPADGGLFFPTRHGTRYNRNSLGLAVSRACDRAGVPHFTPYALRHTRLTEVRDLYGEGYSAAVGGHGLNVNTVYTQQRDVLAARVARETG